MNTKRPRRGLGLYQFGILDIPPYPVYVDVPFVLSPDGEHFCVFLNAVEAARKALREGVK